jgi:hypothetical protein
MEKTIEDGLSLAFLLSWSIFTVTIIVNGPDWIADFMESKPSTYPYPYNLPLYLLLLMGWMFTSLAAATILAAVHHLFNLNNGGDEDEGRPD